MPKCTFCGTNIQKGTGKMFIYTSGKIANFCSSKCEKNLLKLKRKPLKTRWTQEWIKENKKGSAEAKKEPAPETKEPVKEEPVARESKKEEPAEKTEEAEEAKSESTPDAESSTQPSGDEK